MHGIPPISTILHILFNEETCVEYLNNLGVFYLNRLCPICDVNMKYYETKKKFRCTKKNCSGTLSYKANTFFWKSKMPCCQVVFINIIFRCFQFFVLSLNFKKNKINQSKQRASPRGEEALCARRFILLFF